MDALPDAATVFLVDDDPSVLRAVARLVRSAGWNVETFASAQSFLEREPRDVHGCLVLDVAMPGLNGLELQQALTRSGSSYPIVFLTGHGDIPMSVRAIKAGAVDFLSKPCGDEDLLAAIALALKHSAQAHAARIDGEARTQRLATLTPREHEVMLGVVAGKLNKQIAAELGTVEKTIKVHRARVMKKLAVTSVADLVRLVERTQAG